jgi:pimeloyl-ACP methyl ester carboxylesterase
MKMHSDFEAGYSEVNGLRMYYEIYGSGNPLVLIHGGGSTIDTTFGKIIPKLARQHQVIAVEMQAHGHTSDRDTPLSFGQDAEDIATLLKNLNIEKANFLGFSNGGQTLIELALRHPILIRKMILASIFYKKTAVPQQFWEGFNHATLNDMPALLQEGYLAANNDPAGLLTMFNRDVERMRGFKGWTEEQVKSIDLPVLIINATRDVAPPEHAVELYRLFPNAELAIFPGGHGEYLGAIESLGERGWPKFNATDLIEYFLEGYKH